LKGESMSDTIEDKIIEFEKKFYKHVRKNCTLVGYAPSSIQKDVLKNLDKEENWLRSALLSQHQSDISKFKEALGEMEEETFIETCENCDGDGYGRAWFGHGEPTHELYGDKYEPTGSVVFCKKCFEEFGIGKEWMGEEIWKRTSNLEEHNQMRINSITKVSKENKARNALRKEVLTKLKEEV